MWGLRQYFPNLKRWQLPADQLPPATSPIKQQLIDEVNALGIKGMPHIDNLFVPQGSFVNLEYTINGNKVKLLDDNATYWGNQVERQGADGFLALPHWLWLWGAGIVVIKVINQISAIVMYKKCLFLPIRFPYIRHALNI